MRIIYVLLVLIQAVLMRPAYSLDRAKKKSKEKSTETKESNISKESASVPSDSNEDSSTYIRGQKKFGGSILYTPLSDFLLQYGVRPSYQINPRVQVGFTFLTGKEDFKNKVGDSGSAKIVKAQGSGMSFFGDVRYFVGNSFSVLSGLGYRTASISYRIEDSLYSIYVEGTMQVNSIVIPLFIGNHWAWKNGLTLGCDWIGALVPISGSSSVSTEGNLSSESVKEINDSFADVGKSLSRATSLTLFLVSAGYSF